jgi:phospholipase/lecithinase/hemolysin
MQLKEHSPMTGFREPLKACYGAGSFVGSTYAECADPGQHVFWDVIHFTSEFAARLAKEAFSGTTFVRPMNILQAFVLPKLQPAATASKEA